MATNEGARPDLKLHVSAEDTAFVGFHCPAEHKAEVERRAALEGMKPPELWRLVTRAYVKTGALPGQAPACRVARTDTIHGTEE